MKKISLYILIASVFLMPACKRDFLNTTPLTSISSDLTWTDGGLAEAFVTNIYNGLGNGGWYEQQLASLSDEAVFVHPERNINTVNEGTLSATNPGWEDGTY